MHKKIGSFQGFSFCLFVLSFLLLITSSSWAATKFLIIAPGHTYNGSTAPDRSSPSTQVAGEAFNLNIYCYDDGDQAPRNSNFATTTLSADSASEIFSPSTAFTLPETFVTIPNARRGGSNAVTADLRPASTGTVNISVAGSGGISGDSTGITVQRITQFTVTKPGTITAGVPFAVTIEARDASSLCDAFNGSATLTAIDSGPNGSDRNLGTIDFEDGKFMGHITLFHATNTAAFRIRYRAGTPVEVDTTTSTYTIDPNSFTKILLLAPGETHYPGTSGGDGQQGSPTTQTAGTSFAMTAYGVDDYWNIVSSASGTVTLEEDGSMTAGGSAQSFSSGVASFPSVTLYVVGDGNLTINATHSGSAGGDTTVVPLNPDSLDSFAFTNSFAATYTAGVGGSAESIDLTIIAIDAYGNSVGSVSGTSTMVIKYGSTTLSSTYESWAISPSFSSGAFSNGVYTGTLSIRRAENNYTITIENDTGGVSDVVSDSFDVNAGSDYWHIVIMPGQTYTPGERHSGVWGRSGSPSNVSAGNSVSIDVYATDSWGNRTTHNDSLDWDAASHLTVTDAGASASPDPITITNGYGSTAITLTVASTTQDISLPSDGFPPSGLLVRSSGTFTVVHTDLDHFSVSTNATQTAGDQFTMTIRAQDQYNNDVQNFASNVYVTCPQLDYFTPTESVVQIDGATKNYTSGSSTANWQVSSGDFSAGVANKQTRIYRAADASQNAVLFVSDVATDTPSSNTGNIGQSVVLTINPNTYSTMFCYVPGISYRPGADASGNPTFAGVGYTGSPLSQQADSPFSVTVYATDAYWNLRSEVDEDYEISTGSNDSKVGEILLPETFSLENGVDYLEVTFLDETEYRITINNPLLGVASYTTPYQITSFDLDHFNIELTSGGTWPANWIAGVPVDVSITAYTGPNDATDLATTFNGTADLACPTLDHDTTLKTIRPTSITFTDGVWNGEVTLFRAESSPGQTHNIQVRIGSKSSIMPVLNVIPNIPDRLLIIEEGGMDLFNGLNPDVDPTGELSIQGQPAIQTAGTPITKIDFYLCDAYWNRVTSTTLPDSTGEITIECNDPFPAQITGEGSFTGGTLNVNLGNKGEGYEGVYSAEGTFVLYTVNGTTGQSISVSMGGYTGFELGAGGYNAVPVKHAAPDVDISSPYDSSTRRFSFHVDSSQAAFDSGEAVAGVPFAVTVAAVDAYGNTLDSLNGALAFGPFTNVNLTAQTDTGGSGTVSIWPTKLGTLSINQWIEGVSYPWVYPYKKATGVGQQITASYDFGNGPRTGESPNFTVKANSFGRLVAYVNGMSIPDDLGAGGTYNPDNYGSTPPPASASIFNNFGTPSGQTAGNNVSSLRAYSCDIYGNIIKSPTSVVTMTTSDPFADLPGDQSISAANGYADFSNLFDFHTQGSATVTFTDTTIPATVAGVSPNINIDHNSYYGLQILVPGLKALEGSGLPNVTGINPVPPGGWYSGVTPTDHPLPKSSYEGRAQLIGAPFPVTVQAVDLYGNFIDTVKGNTIELATEEDSPASTPNASAPLYQNLVNGRANFIAGIVTPNTIRQLRPSDTSDGSKIGYPSSLASVRIANSDELEFRVFVNGVGFGSPAVALEAYPNTFNVRVEVRYQETNQIVSTSQSFKMWPVLNFTQTPGNGNLAVTESVTYEGVKEIPLQTYTRAENIYIEVSNLQRGDNPEPGFSPPLQIKASDAASIEMRADAGSFSQSGNTIYQVEANEESTIYARALDENGNPISSGTVIDFSISPSGISELAPVQNTTDNNGTATTIFTAGAQNRSYVITAQTGDASGTLNMEVTVTSDGGVYPNPYNPLLGQPVRIDYPLEADAPVKVEIYTLMGDLVWSKSFPAGDSEGGHAGVNSVSWFGKNSQGVTIANGGYIVLIKANDNEKFRFKLGVFKEQ